MLRSLIVKTSPFGIDLPAALIRCPPPSVAALSLSPRHVSKAANVLVANGPRPTSEDWSWRLRVDASGKITAGRGSAAAAARQQQQKRRYSSNARDKGGGGISFRVIKESMFPEVNDLLYANFHSDEPMSKAIGVFDGANRNSVLDYWAEATLKENLSIMAVDEKTNDLLGVCLNGVLSRYDPDVPLPEESNKCFHIANVLKKLNEKAGGTAVYDRHNADTFFYVFIVTTDKNKRRGGLGKDLIRRSIELARALGFPAARAEATGAFSKKAFESVGFHLDTDYSYADYSHGGKNAFEGMEEVHTACSMMIKKL